jgi:WD40 repeat protein
MRFGTVLWAATAGVALFAPGVAQAQGIVFSKDVVPILRDGCAKCHNSKQAAGGFSVSSFAELEKGGKSGKVLAPKAVDARLIKLIDGPKPAMPPGSPLPKAQIDKLKAWVDQGAKIDVAPTQIVIGETAIPVIKVPKIAVKVPTLPQAAALAWSKDGKVLAIGTYQMVKLVDPATGAVLRELKGHTDVVHSVQFSPDQKLLAAAGGPPAQQGEVKIWDVASGNLVRTITGHSDYIYSAAWSPDGKKLATASYDKLIKLWDTENGNELKTLKDHADAVYAVAFNPAGTLLASGSADRSIKVWDVNTGRRIYTLTGHNDVVYSLGFNAAGNQITSCGADRTVRTWNINAQNGNQARNTTAHEKSVNEVVYSADGTVMASVSDDRTAKVFNAANGGVMQHVKDQSDALLSAAISPDNKLVALGGYDGTVRVYNIADGKLVATLIDLPKPPEPKPAPPKADPKAPAAKPAEKKP